MAVEALSDLVLVNVAEGHHLGVNMGQQLDGGGGCRIKM